MTLFLLCIVFLLLLLLSLKNTEIENITRTNSLRIHGMADANEKLLDYIQQLKTKKAYSLDPYIELANKSSKSKVVKGLLEVNRKLNTDNHMLKLDGSRLQESLNKVNACNQRKGKKYTKRHNI